MPDKRNLRKLTSTVQYITDFWCTVSLSFVLLHPSPLTTRTLNPVIAYFLNTLNHAFILFFLSLLLLSLFTSSISYAVKKAWVSYFKKACFKSSKSIIGSGLSTQPSWFSFSLFKSVLSPLLDESSKNVIFIMPLPWLKTILVPYHLLDQV